MNDNQHIPSGYKSSPLGIIPDDWEVKRLGDIAEITSGTTPSRDNNSFYSNGTIPWVKTTDLNNGVLNKTEELVTEAAIEQTSLKVLPIGTVLVAMYGGLNQIGRTALLGMDATVNQALSALVCKQGVFNSYVLAWLNCKVGDWKRLAASSRKDPNITGKDVERFPILVPKIEEQQRIVSVLSLWDTAIAKQIALIEQLTLRKRGLMQQLLTGKKRLKGFEGEWKEVRLGDVGAAYSGLINKNKDDFENGNALFITYMNVFSNGKINTNNLGQVRILPSEKQEKVQYGDIFFTVSSETPDEVGMASVLLNEIQNTYLNSFCFGYRLNDFKTIIPIYASYFFRGNDFRKEMFKIAQGSTRFNISKTEVLSMIITIPSIEEQNAIASVLVNADKEIEIQKQKLAALQEQKKGLMQVLLTGKKRIK